MGKVPSRSFPIFVARYFQDRKLSAVSVEYLGLWGAKLDSQSQTII